MDIFTPKEKATEHVVLKPSVYASVSELADKLKCNRGEVIEFAMYLLEKHIKAQDEIRGIILYEP